MATDEQTLSLAQQELVAAGASIGAGCHPCVDHHLKAGAMAAPVSVDEAPSEDAADAAGSCT